jgi:5-(carboxyamino)imidazole ribonucleotide mutase
MPEQRPPLSSGPSLREGAARVAIVMGSDSDFPVMRAAAEALAELGVGYEMSVVSAHRTPVEMADFARAARARGVRVIVAGAGGAAHLPGMIAAHTELPVVGVPVPMPPLNGQDALLSIVQMPRGVPVASVAIGNAWNAGLLAAQIVGAGGAESDEGLLDRIAAYKEGLRQAVLAKTLPPVEGPEGR